MGRRRVGVALLLDAPVADEVDGLRRAVGDPSLGRIPPHITLVRPLNLKEADLPAALARLRAAAGSVPPVLRLTLGPPATFAPVNPVLYLEVGGDLADLRRLRDAVLVAPLDRPSPWPWVPHVTLADGLEPAGIEAATAVLGRYAALAPVDRVVLLEERSADAAPGGPPGGPPRRWFPLADASLGPEAVVGRGGLALSIARGRLLGPDLAALAGADDIPAAPPYVVLTALRDGSAVGGAAAWWDGGALRVGVLVTPAARGQGVGSHLLAALESFLHGSDLGAARPEASGPGGFYAARSRWVTAHA